MSFHALPASRTRSPGGIVSRTPSLSTSTIDDALAARMLDYLLTRYGMRRPPESAARLLALICDLHERGLPFPLRDEAADLVGCTKFGIDSALSVMLSRGDITMDVRLRPGNVVQRDSVIRERFYTPNREIRNIARERRS